jgi:regulator of RNase E activity RraA
MKMTFDDIMHGRGIREMVKLDIAAHKKFGEHGVRSTQVVNFDDKKIVGKIVTVDGKTHRMTIKK